MTEATAETDPERSLDHDPETGIEVIVVEILQGDEIEMGASEVLIDRDATAKVALRLPIEGTRMISTI